MHEPASTDAPGVPYALDASGQVVEPGDANPGQPYTCLACHEPVSPVRAHTRLIHGQQRPWRAHFSHRPGSDCRASGESILHLAYKRLLRWAIERHRGLDIGLICPDCEQASTFDYQLAPGDTVATEVWTGPYRADVAVLGMNGLPDFAVEVLHTHQVPEPKAQALPLPWVEVRAMADRLFDFTQRPHAQAVNTNLFTYLPCECGNDAASYPLAQVRKAARIEQARQDHLAELAQQQDARQSISQARDQALRHEARQRTMQREQERVQHQALQAWPREERQQTRRYIESFLDTNVPEVHTRLLVFTCVLGPCPGCRMTTVFFDPGGMNMMPTWTPLAWQASAFHPLECVCPSCGWHRATPPDGERITFHQRTEATKSTPAAAHANAPVRFWWHDNE